MHGWLFLCVPSNYTSGKMAAFILSTASHFGAVHILSHQSLVYTSNISRLPVPIDQVLVYISKSALEVALGSTLA